MPRLPPPRSNERFSIVEFSTWPLLHQFEAPENGQGADILIKPDGFIRIHEKEVDGVSPSTRSSKWTDRPKPRTRSSSRALAYRAHYASGGFAERNAPRDPNTRHTHSSIFRAWLSAGTTPALAFSEATAHLHADISDHASGGGWQTVSAIWMIAPRYREAVRGTPFDTDRPSPQGESIAPKRSGRSRSRKTQ